MARGDSLPIWTTWLEGVKFLVTRAPLILEAAGPWGLAYVALLTSRHRFDWSEKVFEIWGPIYRALDTPIAATVTDLLLAYILVRIVTCLYEISVAGETRTGMASLIWGINELRLIGTTFASGLIVLTYFLTAIVAAGFLIWISAYVLGWLGLGTGEPMSDFWLLPLDDLTTPLARTALGLEVAAASLFVIGLLRVLAGLSLAFPVAIIERRITLTTAWTLTEGSSIILSLSYGVGLIAALLVIAVPFGIADILLVGWLTGMSIEDFLDFFVRTELFMTPGEFIPVVLLYLLGLVLIMSTVGAIAGIAGAAYRDRSEQL